MERNEMLYRFAGFELDPAGYLLSRGGEPIRLEPRVLELLAYLVAHREGVVTKEELFARVWKGQAVSDAALSRAVYELRRAVGDDSERQAILRTVHGRGYRFVAAVEEGTEAAGPAAGIAPPSDGAPRITPGPAPPAAAAGRWPALLAVAFTVVVVGLAVPFARSPTRSPDAVPATPATSAAPASRSAPDSSPAAPRRLAVLPLATQGDDAEIELVALSLAELIAARLAALPGFLMRSPDYSAELATRAASLTELARASGVDFVLTGSAVALPETGRVRVAFQLVDATAKAALPLGTYEVPRLQHADDVAEFRRLRDAVAADVLEHLIPALPAPPDEPTPRNLEAFRLYLHARQRLARATCGDGAAIAELLDRSLALDPTFSRAWVAKGFAQSSQTAACGRDASYAHQALAAVERALELEPDMALALYLEVLLLTELGRTEDAYVMAREAHGRRPGSPTLLYAQSCVLRFAGHLPQAEKTLRTALRRDPLVLDETGEAPLQLLYLGQVEEFLDLVSSRDTPQNRFHRGLALTLLERQQAAREVLEPAFRLNPNDLFARYASALLAILEGDQQTAAEIVRGVVRQRRALSSPDGEATYTEAGLLALAGEPEAALDRLANAVDQGFFCSPCLRSDPLLRTLRSEAAFAKLLARAERRHRAFGERFSFAGFERDPGPEQGAPATNGPR
jgi:DNA-binding winged helix-turn-helix (wHTH) protein/TolB-like protein